MLASGTWERTHEYVLAPNGTPYEKTAIGEIQVIAPDPAATGHQIRGWYAGGWDTAAVHTAYSNDGGITWTRTAGNPVIGQGAGGESGHAAHIGVVRDPADGKVHVFYAATIDLTPVPLYAASSTDGGLSFGNRRVILNASGWETGVWGNTSCVIDDGGTWHLLYECYDTSNVWQMGYATSPDGNTWTRQNGGNPLTSLRVGSGMYGGPDLHRLPDGTWELFYHAATSGNLPTNIYRATSSDLIHWSRHPGVPVLAIGGFPNEVDQVADACMFELDGQRIMLYGGADNATATGGVNRAVYVPPS